MVCKILLEDNVAYVCPKRFLQVKLTAYNLTGKETKKIMLLT